MGTIISAIEDGVLLLRLQNGAANAMSADMAGQLKAAVAGLPDAVGAVVIAGTDDGAFCAGSDIRELLELQKGGDGPGPLLRVESEALRAIAAVPVPTIAAVDGAAFGGGMELAACCDFVIAGERACFCLPEVMLGVFPCLGGTVWIPRRVGYARALELMIAGNEIDAATAQDWSFVNRIVAAGRAAEEAMRLARRVAQGPREAVRMIKLSLRDNFGGNEATALAAALERAIDLGRSPEAREGLRAFAAREKPDFAAARSRAKRG